MAEKGLRGVVDPRDPRKVAEYRCTSSLALEPIWLLFPDEADGGEPRGGWTLRGSTSDTESFSLVSGLEASPNTRLITQAAGSG